MHALITIDTDTVNKFVVYLCAEMTLQQAIENQNKYEYSYLPKFSCYQHPYHIIVAIVLYSDPTPTRAVDISVISKGALLPS